MALAETPTPLDGLASAASVLLIIELSLIVVLLAAIAILFAVALHWLRAHIVPLVETYTPRARSVLGSADRGLGAIIERLADLYGRRRGVERFVRVFLESLFPAFFAPQEDRAKADHSDP